MFCPRINNNFARLLIDLSLKCFKFVDRFFCRFISLHFALKRLCSFFMCSFSRLLNFRQVSKIQLKQFNPIEKID